MVGMPITVFRLELEFQSVPGTKQSEGKNQVTVLNLKHKYQYTLGGALLKILLRVRNIKVI